MLSRRDFVKQATLISLAPTVPAFLVAHRPRSFAVAR